MLKTKPNALRVVEATLGKVKKVKKPGFKIYYPHCGIMAGDELPRRIQQHGAVG